MDFTLTSQILRSQSIETLVRWHKQVYIMDIEREIGDRLSSCDFNVYNPVINYMFDHQDTTKLFESIYVVEGLYNALDCIDWKIGVVYDYTIQNNQVKSVSIIVGNLPYRYPTGYPRGYFKPNWLTSDQTKLMLREVTSKSSNVKNDIISLKTDNKDLDNHIRSE